MKRCLNTYLEQLVNVNKFLFPSIQICNKDKITVREWKLGSMLILIRIYDNTLSPTSQGYLGSIKGI